MVPMTPQGARLLRELVAYAKARGRAELFTVKPARLDAQFRKVTRGLMVENLHFHDARATALTHLSRRVNVLDLAKISGHRNLNLLSTVYYREAPEAIAGRLSRASSPASRRSP